MQPGSYFSQHRTEMLPFVPAASRHLMEIGCAEGHFAAALKTGDREVWGMEMNVGALQKARAQIHQVLEGDITKDHTQIKDQYFDCFVLNDVIEHLPQPYETLQLLMSKLKPGGSIVGSIPNVRFYKVSLNLLLKGRWDTKDSGILDRTHFQFFTQKSFQRECQRRNLRLVRLQGINHSSSVPLKLLSLISAEVKDLSCRQMAFQLEKPQ